MKKIITKNEILQEGWVESLPHSPMVTTEGIPKYYEYVKQNGKRITVYKMTIGGPSISNTTFKIQIKNKTIFIGTILYQEDLNRLMKMLRIIPHDL